MLAYVVTGLICTLIGAVLGHWLTISRDRRAEFNQVAEPLYERLERQALLCNEEFFPNDANSLGQEDFILFKRHLPRRKHGSIDRAIAKYEQAKLDAGSFEHGKYSFDHPRLLIEAIEDLQSFLTRR